MHYLHTMVRVGDLDAALDFYCAKLGLTEMRREENAKGRFTLVFLATPDDAIVRITGDVTCSGTLIAGSHECLRRTATCIGRTGKGLVGVLRLTRQFRKRGLAGIDGRTETSMEGLAFSCSATSFDTS